MTAAIDKTYDGIILGAGHHGLVLGSYLAKCGLDILLVDRRLKYGGGLSTEEATVPGFYHNLHSINHFHITETPWFKDLGLADRVTYITPRYELGQPHLDGSVLVFGRDLEETLANVARFSKKDAQTFRDWNRKAGRSPTASFCRNAIPSRCRRRSERRCWRKARSAETFLPCASASRLMW
jgi:phytoene dehydrogenase-like protein